MNTFISFIVIFGHVGIIIVIIAAKFQLDASIDIGENQFLNYGCSTRQISLRQSLAYWRSRISKFGYEELLWLARWERSLVADDTGRIADPKCYSKGPISSLSGDAKNLRNSPFRFRHVMKTIWQAWFWGNLPCDVYWCNRSLLCHSLISAIGFWGDWQLKKIGCFRSWFLTRPLYSSGTARWLLSEQFWWA